MTRCEASLNFRVFRDQGWIGGLPVNKPDQALNPESRLRIATVYENFRVGLVWQLHFGPGESGQLMLTMIPLRA